MAENYILEGYKGLGDRIGAFCIQNKAHIFTALGIGGTIATGVLSAKDGAKAARRIDSKQKELGRRLNWKEKTMLCWKDYIDAGLVCGLACFSEFKSDQINTRTIADRTALLIASEKAYEKLSTKTREVLGEKKTQQIKDEIVKEEAKANPGMYSVGNWDHAPRVGTGQLFPFVDDYSGFRFWSNLDYIEKCVLKLQKMMTELEERGGPNDYYDKPIGIPYSEALAFWGADAKTLRNSQNRDFGWNKGFQPDGSGDDPIEIRDRTTIEDEPGFAVTVLHWEKNPTDMKLGRLIKSNYI